MQKNISKKVKYALPAQQINMDGFPVKQALPTLKVDQVDPYLLVHHGKAKYSNLRPAKHQGIGPHPHRGFSPVTFVIQGEVHHRDSRGNNQIAKAGEVQWMHAGMGIIHSERPSEAIARKKIQQEIVQVWINSPAKSKMKIPLYQYLPEDEMPVLVSEDQLVRTKLIAGNYGNLHGKIETESPLLILWSRGLAKGKTSFHIPLNYNSSLYLIAGKVRLKAYGLIDPETLLVFEDQGDKIEIEFKEDAQFLILAGKPIKENVIQSGPYVMNTETEILEAMRDYQMGKMGILIEDD